MRPLLPETGPDLVETMAQRLREVGYAVDTAAGGPEGLDKPLTRDCGANEEVASSA